MANKMLIDASHPEETRVVVLRGNRVEEFDFESASKKQLRGNIYLAKVTRVEPSLQAAFVDYGGNRHGFLAFSEIHPDYYQIPVADRQAILEEEARAHQEHEEDEERSQRRSRRHRRDRNGNDRNAEKRTNHDGVITESAPDHEVEADGDEHHEPDVIETLGGESGSYDLTSNDEVIEGDDKPADVVAVEAAAEAPAAAPVPAVGDIIQIQAPVSEVYPLVDAGVLPAVEVVAPVEAAPVAEQAATDHTLAVDAEGYAIVEEHDHDEPDAEAEARKRARDAEHSHGRIESDDEHHDDEADHVEHIGGDAMEELPNRAPRYRKQYKIQEVIKRRQVLLIQVVKEERGNKGAALTTYLSLAGRYSVLMPNTARGGGISRKITDASDRKRLKAIAQELEVPEGMGVILRTAGASRTKPEVKRDFEYLLRMWETVRELTLGSVAPSLVYEEGSLIKRAIRDLYNKDIDEVIVSGDNGYREAKDFMRMLMPSHTRNVQPYRDPQPIFAKAGAEAQLDAMFSNQVTLKSGGYIVINQTEALVAIDVNSGRSTREHNIEDTAVRTNLEAADEVARQLRLRDLAGLIVVDFIDMEENRNNRAVERRIKDALKNDRARIQVGRISHFGLLEMSRQRIRTGVLEGSTVICPHCAGAGMVRSTASIALHVLRVLEDTLIRNAAHNITVRTRTIVALYILNQKRSNLRGLEERFGVTVTVAADDTLTGTTYHAMERGELATGLPAPMLNAQAIRPNDTAFISDEIEEDVEIENEDDETNDEGVEARDDDKPRAGETAEEGERRRRRRRRRRGRGADREGSGIAANAPQPSDDGLAFAAEIGGDLLNPAAEPNENGEGEQPADGEERAAKDGERSRRRRSRRGGRRNREGQRLNENGTVDTSEGEGSDDDVAGDTEAGDDFAPAGSEAMIVQAESDAVGMSVPAAVVEAAPVAETPRFEAPAAVVVEAPAAPVAEPASVPVVEAPAAPVAAVVPEAKPEPAPSPVYPQPEPDPSRPKRSGWWQKAKATLSGH